MTERANFCLQILAFIWLATYSSSQGKWALCWIQNLILLNIFAQICSIQFYIVLVIYYYTVISPKS